MTQLLTPHQRVLGLALCACDHERRAHKKVTVDRTGQYWGGGVVTVTSCLDCPSLNRDHGFVEAA